LLLALVGVQLSRNWRQKATSTQRTHRVRRGHRLIIVVLLLLSRSRARGERRAAAVGDAAVADAAPVLVADDFFRPSCGLRERL